MKTTVIIPTLNRPETLRETLESYFSGSVIPEQIIIVDQTTDENQRDNIRKILDNFSATTKIDYLFQAEPSSTKARNLGIKNAENEIIIFSDDDVTVQKDTLKNIAEIMEDPSVAMISGINSRDEISRSKIGFIFGKKSYKNRYIGHVTKSMFGRFPDKVVEGNVDTQWAMGFFFVVRKSLLEKSGILFDEKLTTYAYAEDLDFSYTYYKCASSEGFKCILSYKVIVEHRQSTEHRIPPKKYTMMYVINREYLSYKHNKSVLSRVSTRWCNFGDFLIRLVRRQKPFDLLHAQIVCDKHRKELKQGILCKTWYEE
ncbi:glycosyltransferase family 2 protein [bacterium]|nr:glycosyltransferase family 2 protein [bacterium]